jgi:phosphoribosylamine--glycine ligase
MNLAVIGSGGREHAICHKLSTIKRVQQLYCFPGNAGTAKIAQNISINLDNFNELKNFIKTNNIDLIIVRNYF